MKHYCYSNGNNNSTVIRVRLQRDNLRIGYIKNEIDEHKYASIYEPKLSQLDNVLLTYTKHRLFKYSHAWLVKKVYIKELIKRNKKQTAVINIRKYQRISRKK